MIEQAKHASIMSQLDRFAEAVQFVGRCNDEHCTVLYIELRPAPVDADSMWYVTVANNCSNKLFYVYISFDSNENLKYMYINDEVDDNNARQLTWSMLIAEVIDFFNK